MKRRKHDPAMFASIEARAAKGEKVNDLCKEHKITSAHFYSWRQRQRNKKAKIVSSIQTTNSLDAARYASVNAAINRALTLNAENTVNVSTASGAAGTSETSANSVNTANESRGFLLIGTPKFLAEVMNSL